MDVINNGTLRKDFYINGDVVGLAKNLIGKTLSTSIDGVISSGIITETEAYAGITDKASHAYGNKRTKRTEAMYCEGGTAYVYLCYGMHYLFNIVTNIKDVPHAVLIRAIYPIEGLDMMLKRTGKNAFDKKAGIGPGKVTKLLGINNIHNGISLTGNDIWLNQNGIEIKDSYIHASPRIGIDYAGEDALLPWRFYVEHNYFNTMH